METAPAAPISMAMNWEPLPARETSSRQQRRRMRTEPSSQPAKAPPKVKRKPNRPGFNSYLKVILDDATMDRLHEVATRIQTKVQELEKKKLAETPQGQNEAPEKIKGEEEQKSQNTPQESKESDKDKYRDLPPIEANVEKSKDPSLEAGENRASPGISEEGNATKEGGEQKPSNAKQKKGKSDRGRKNQPPRFKPRSRASLHMTFFFGGEYLCKLPPSELRDWYDKVASRLTEANFVLSPKTELNSEKEGGNSEEHGKAEAIEKPAASETQETDPDMMDIVQTTERTSEDDTPKDNNIIDDYWFDVTDVRLFPPSRNNLIVAHLEASPAWHELHKDVRDIAKNADSQGLKEVTAYSKEKWTAHITMGNIFGGGSKAQVRKAFTEVLQQVMHELEAERDQEGKEESPDKAEQCLFKARTHGIGMGGPVPEQVEGLDWDFIYKPKQKVETEK